MKKYDHAKIEKKWQKFWEQKKIYQAKTSSPKKKFYPLVEFPYPSGAGLHTGHIRSYTAMDIVARKRRMEGFNVLYPMGWDAFGLPTENYAIKTGIQPRIVTKQNTDNFRRQLKMLGFSFDWSREINTTDPKYYKWTQWIFLELFKKGLAYKDKMPINWCLSCKIGLANEEVIDGRCERCGSITEKREKEQWMLAITKYADRLAKDLDDVNYLERIKTQQRNWIGKSEGAEIEFKLKGGNHKVKIFTTRPDTLFGATYLVLAPEHPLVATLEKEIKNFPDVRQYILDTLRKSEMDRMAEGKEKTGVELKGISAINPTNNEEIPVWIADYVLNTYGTGAIMAVPAHDERDFEFAQKYTLSVRQVIENSLKGLTAFVEIGKLINSGQFNGLSSEEAKKKITDFVGGKIVTKYKLRDWVFSRQRYWGEPIPMIKCKDCGWVPVPLKDLPVKLPELKGGYKPSDTGESPLAAISKWVNVKCPTCKGKAERETDTMPNWAGSSWYYLRYTDPKNAKALAGKEALEYFMPVDWYNGGMEHTTLHLLYSRFWHKFLYDIGVVGTSEPYMKRTSHGLILAEGGEKMSKSKGNVVNPDDLVKLLGADTLRLYEMFMGPFDQAIVWDTNSMAGSRRFIERVYNLALKVSPKGAVLSPNTESLLHQTIKKVGEDVEDLKLNTAVSHMMILSNALEKEEKIPVSAYHSFLKILAPFIPHVTEELWGMTKGKGSIHTSEWPLFDESKISSGSSILAVQVNGKVRGTLEVTSTDSQESIEKRARELASVAPWLLDKTPKKVIYVKGKILNFVI